MKILLCYDGSKVSDIAIDKSMAMFRHLEPKFIVTMIADVERAISTDLMCHDGKLAANVDQWEEDMAECLTKAVDKMTRKGFSVDKLYLKGNIEKTLVELAHSKDPDLVVVGRHGKDSGIKKFLLGSISYHVVRNVKHPVMVVQ